MKDERCVEVVDKIRSECPEWELDSFELIREQSEVWVYRCRCGGVPAVVKHFGREEDRREILNYRLLKELCVPTMRILALKKSCIVMEDISASQLWRLGMEEDMSDPAVAAGLAEWYFLLHESSENDPRLAGMYSENDLLSREALGELSAQIPGTEALCRWLSGHLEEVKQMVSRKENVLTYNDFYWTNFIVRKDHSAAMMFDFNLMGKGYRYADLRNVESSVSERFFRVFMEEYEKRYRQAHGCAADLTFEKRLDELLSPVCGLISALRRSVFPHWAESMWQEAIDGTLLKRAQNLL